MVITSARPRQRLHFQQTLKTSSAGASPPPFPHARFPVRRVPLSPCLGHGARPVCCHAALPNPSPKHSSKGH